MSCMKFFKPNNTKNSHWKRYYSEHTRVSACMHSHKDTNANIYENVCGRNICYSQHHRKIAAHIDLSAGDIPFSLSLLSLFFSLYLLVDSGIPNTYHRICVTTFAMHKHTGRVPFSRCVWTFLMKFMKYAHDTSWMHKETRLSFGRWLEKAEKGDANGQWSGSLTSNHNKR